MMSDLESFPKQSIFFLRLLNFAVEKYTGSFTLLNQTFQSDTYFAYFLQANIKYILATFSVCKII